MSIRGGGYKVQSLLTNLTYFFQNRPMYLIEGPFQKKKRHFEQMYLIEEPFKKIRKIRPKECYISGQNRKKILEIFLSKFFNFLTIRKTNVQGALIETPPLRYSGPF